MPNRFEVNRRRAIIAGCIFCCAAVGIAFSGGAHAAMIAAEIQLTGTQFMGGDSSLVWQISNSNSSVPPLVCGQEVVMGAMTESFLSGNGGSYHSVSGLQNADLVRMQSQKDISLTGPGAYSESLAYEGYGAGQPAGGCGYGESGMENVGSQGNETIPAVDPYCSAFMVSTNLVGSNLKYQSVGGIVSGDLELPDMAGFQFSGNGDGFGTVYAGSMSMTPVYSNKFSERAISGGKPFTISGKFEFTSFAKTFDSPTVEG